MTPRSEERLEGVASTDVLRLERAEGYSQCRIMQRSGTPQYAEFSVAAGGARARVCIGYRRCCEFDKGDQPGQDYAVVRAGGGYVVGVVADGVSRSFYGNLAAKYVATWLVEELWRRHAHTPDTETMERLLKEAEAEFADSVKDYRIPKDLSPYLIPILERKRHKGSQAVFAAFVLNVEEGGLILYQAGDVSALVHNSGPEPELVESPAEGRWSSAGTSALLLQTTSFENVRGVVIKSDGASKEWGRTLDAAALDPERFSLMAKARAPLDDVSFVAVRLDADASMAAASTRRVAGDTQAVEKPVEAETGRPQRPPQTAPAVLNDKKTHTWKQGPSVSDGADSGVAAAKTVGAADQTSAGGDAPARGEKEGDRTREGAGQDRAAEPEARAAWRAIRIFGAGVVVGLAAGALLTLLVVFAVAPPRGGPAAATPDAKETAAPQTPPGSQTTPAAESAAVSVEAKQSEQRTFLNAHRDALPKLIGDNQTTSPGEVITRVSAEGVDLAGVVFVLGVKDVAAERGRDEDGQPSFFARLKGLAAPSPVTIRLLGRDGKALYEGQLTLRGRESKAPPNKDPFLGYYEISVKRGG